LRGRMKKGGKYSYSEEGKGGGNKLQFPKKGVL